jgi:hypothetical protein
MPAPVNNTHSATAQEAQRPTMFMLRIDIHKHSLMLPRLIVSQMDCNATPLHEPCNECRDACAGIRTIASAAD